MSKEKLYALLEAAKREHLYGEITFCFRNGVLSLIRQQKTIAPNGVTTNGNDNDNPNQ